jgi:Tfp pilus assembly protein FimT
VTHAPGEDGFSLPEAALALALLGLLLAVSLPALASGLSRGRVATAAREMAGEMARLRSEAIAERRRVALRIAWSDGRYVYSVYADGDGDGVRSDDIAALRDPLLAGPRDLRSRYEGIDFGLLDAAIPEVPPAPGVLAPQSDPVRFGASDTITFTPWGTSSTGTLYVSDGKESVQAVVLYGRTGRIRIWRFDRALWRWAR